MKGKYKGIILSVVSVDANSGVFLVAFVVDESENKNSWAWFFKYLKQHIVEGKVHSWTIMSDRKKGIISALEQSLTSGIMKKKSLSM